MNKALREQLRLNTRAEYGDEKIDQLLEIVLATPPNKKEEV